ncbi:MAG: arginase family protein [Bdellovibrionales bacterium]
MDKSNFTIDNTSSYENGLFGIPTTYEDSRIVVFPVRWEATTSYGNGTSQGPDAILKASPQLDLYLPDLPNHYEKGFHWHDIKNDIYTLNKMTKPIALNVIDAIEKSYSNFDTAETKRALEEINGASKRVNDIVYDVAQKAHSDGKILAIVGGDHSSPYGAIKCLCEKYDGRFGILHIDAHMDLRERYQGFEHSHASIMNNVLRIEKHRKVSYRLV